MKLTDLRGILHYIPEFRERTFILAIDGEIVTDERFSTLLVDIALLWSLNIRVVLVHGIARQIRRLADERGITPSNTDGTGPTDAATLDQERAALIDRAHRPSRLAACSRTAWFGEAGRPRRAARCGRRARASPGEGPARTASIAA